MIRRTTLCTGVFVVMTLSNGVVPILPALATGPELQSAIYSAYFLGAFATVLPAGILSDRLGRVRFIRTGLLLTFISGAAILVAGDPIIIVAARVVEGIGAGLFIPAAMSWINILPDNTRMSGNFFASLNTGLLAGMVGAGWLADLTGISLAGIFTFTLAAAVPLLLSILIHEDRLEQGRYEGILRIIRNYFWIFMAAAMLIGVTGVVTTLYPELTGSDPAPLSVQIGLMNLATIFTVFIASRLDPEPVTTMVVSSVAMGVSVLLSYISAVGLIMVGAVAGFVIIAQMAYLARTGMNQGVMMGLLNTSSYGGMTLFPFIAGVVAERVSFFAAFLLFAATSAAMAVTIRRCAPPPSTSP
ncbi:MAG: MFS transporter [Methanoculleaceae archaeon]